MKEQETASLYAAALGPSFHVPVMILVLFSRFTMRLPPLVGS